MFFKRLEAIGFKSFATKTVCDFIPGVTVIVGPNGCGKSNIFDAIKWVLGEQAASQMRGKKMQDVIFAGSASFKAMGVAQVTLSIDNQARILPMDYDEIQITRRLYRTGESEYLLNKTPCRLRDIQDLLLGTGIGKSAYSILEQGRVDQIINAKPIERRFLIEEAAGVSKFKVRKLEALRKLERTDVDLSRLKDLLGEIERQTVSLKRQAGRAEKYKELSDISRQLEQELIVLRSTHLREQSQTLGAKTQELKTQLDTLRKSLETQTQTESAMREQEEKLREMLDDEGRLVVDFQARLKECEHETSRLGDRIGGHAARVSQIEEELAELDRKDQDTELKIEEIKQRLESSQISRDENLRLLGEIEARYEQLEAAARSRAERIESLSSEVTSIRDAISRATIEINRDQVRIDFNRQECEQAAEGFDALEEKALESELRHEELTEQSQALAGVIEKLQNDLETRRQIQQDRQKQLVEWMKKIEKTREQLHAGRSRLQTLNELKSCYDGYYQGVREVMAAVQRRELSGIRGAAPNLICTDKEYELAIEVSLATHLQDLVADTAEDAKRAIEYLKRSGRGRATFLPLDRITSTPLAQNLHQILNRPGVFGVASKLVEYEKRIEKAVEYMLGTTIVVETLDVALELGRQGFRARYVSLDGQLINPGGAMTGGRVQSSGLLSREREIRDLDQRVVQLDKDQVECKQLIERLQVEMESEHTAIDSVKKDLDHKLIDQAGLVRDVELEWRVFEEASRILNERRTKQASLEQDTAQRLESIAKWTAEREIATHSLVDAESRLTRERFDAQSQNDDGRELADLLGATRGEVEKTTERMAGAQRELEHTQSELASAERRRLTLRNEIQIIGDEDHRLKDQTERIFKERESVATELEQHTRVFDEQQSLRNTLAVKLREAVQLVERLSHDERELSTQFHEVELMFTQAQSTLSGILEQCHEKFDCELDVLVEKVGIVNKDPKALAEEVADLRGKLDRFGPVNQAALEEYREQTERFESLRIQHKDLVQAKAQLEEAISKLDETTRKLFMDTFEAVRGHFIEMFRRLFNGGKADLLLDAPEGVDPLLDGGIEIVAQPPGKKLQNISLLSGGEKALTAVAMLFGLFLHKPSPFCILDEIDAPLDDVNVDRFKQLLREFAVHTQFIIITHNKLTMELADAIYGVTMEESGVSKLVSVKFDEAETFVDAG